MSVFLRQASFPTRGYTAVIYGGTVGMSADEDEIYSGPNLNPLSDHEALTVEPRSLSQDATLHMARECGHVTHFWHPPGGSALPLVTRLSLSLPVPTPSLGMFSPVSHPV